MGKQLTHTEKMNESQLWVEMEVADCARVGHLSEQEKDSLIKTIRAWFYVNISEPLYE